MVKTKKRGDFTSLLLVVFIYKTDAKIIPNTNTPAPTIVGNKMPILNSGFQLSFLQLALNLMQYAMYLIGVIITPTKIVKNSCTTIKPNLPPKSTSYDLLPSL